MSLDPTALPAWRGALLAAAVLASPTLAQEWVALDDAPPGTPAEILFDAEASNEQLSVVEVLIHGFWMEDEFGPDGSTYQRLDFPGLTLTDRVGAPALPVVRAGLAATADADSFEFLGSERLEVSEFPDLLPAPLFTEGEDEEFDPTFDPGPGDVTGSDPEWAFDADVYGSGETWPKTEAEDAAVAPMLGIVPGASVLAHPVTWDAGTKTLVVANHVKYSWSAAGPSLDPQVITKPFHKVLSQAMLNWAEAQVVFPFDPFQYDARLLIVAQPVWFDTLAPFAFHKRSLGFETTLIATLPFVDIIRNEIAAWYFQGDPGMDHYVLLVGDDDLVPMGFVQKNGKDVWSDDLYGSIGAIDLIKEVHVGRLSVDDEADLAVQLGKIMEYERSPAAGDYSRAFLVAHEEGANGKYVGSHTNVINGSYPAVTPLFLWAFGSALVATNDTIRSAINGGVGLVAYRGHGSTRTWADWNFWGEWWHANDAGGLMNAMLPVVWHIACTNHNIRWVDPGTKKDSLGEVFMEADRGAVASYGATRTTSTTPNHYLNERLFEIVYGAGITNHAQATELAELFVDIHWPGHHNPWAYGLLGDPTMTIRTEQVPIEISFSGGFDLLEPTDLLSVGAISSLGEDLVDGVVSLYKPSFLEGYPDELLGSWWLDEEGQVEIPLGEALATPGPLWITVRDAQGNLVQETVEVTGGPAWVDVGQSLAGELGAPRVTGTGSLQPGTTWQLLLTNARPSSTAWLCLGVDRVNAPFKGGVLVPDLSPPGLALPLPLPADGNLPLASAWPAGVPAGTEFVFQYWVQDASGPFGFTASNGLVATTP